MPGIREAAFRDDKEEEIPKTESKGWFEKYRDPFYDSDPLGHSGYSGIPGDMDFPSASSTVEWQKPGEIKITLVIDTSEFGEIAEYTSPEYDNKKVLDRARSLAEKELDEFRPKVKRDYDVTEETEESVDSIDFIYTLKPKNRA